MLLTARKSATSKYKFKKIELVKSKKPKGEDVVSLGAFCFMLGLLGTFFPRLLLLVLSSFNFENYP